MLVALVGAGILLVAATPVRDLDLGFAVIDSLPADFDARRAAEAAGEGFAPGILSPTVLLIEGTDVGDRRPSLDRLQALLQRQPGVAFVAGPANRPARISIGAVVSTAGDAARYVIVFDASPLSAATIGNLDRLGDAMPALLVEAGIPDVRTSFAGDTALAESTVIQTKAGLGRVVLVATAFGFVLLVLFLRAIVAPLYLMAVNVLAVTAALGVTTFMFQSMAGTSGLTFYVPFAAAVLLVALGADYSIFGVGYIWAEARHRSLLGAIRVAVPRSTRAISAAGITLALSFAMLAFRAVAPLPSVRPGHGRGHRSRRLRGPLPAGPQPHQRGRADERVAGAGAAAGAPDRATSSARRLTTPWQSGLPRVDGGGAGRLPAGQEAPPAPGALRTASSAQKSRSSNG